MGSCLSKKGPSSGPGFSSSSKVAFSAAPDPIKTNPTISQVKAQGKEEESLVKKEIFVIKHRKSHDRPPPQQQHKVADPVASTSNATATTTASSHESDAVAANKNVIASNINFIINGTASSSTTSSAVAATAAGVRTSSCTKEEVDAILIQCGRLSRSSSGKAASGSAAQRSRKYSGSKRSYDFDHGGDNDGEDFGDDDAAAEERLHRERNRPSMPSSPQGRRRRTPSRERDQRSSSKERSSGSRRVSRSPGRRSGNTSTTTNAAPAAANGSSGGGASGRPGKMVSVPATVSSLAMDKNNGGGEPVTTTTTAIKRITVKRNVGEAGSRSTASPRARSPARTNGASDSTRAPSPARINANAAPENPRAPSPARARSPARTHGNGSNENPRSQSPARTNANGPNENQQPSLSRSSSRKAEPSPYRRNPLSEIDPNSLAYPQTNPNNKADGKKLNVAQGANHKTSSNVNSTAKEVYILEDVKGQAQMTKNVTVTTMPQTLTRSRSLRRSQDLDLNPSYTSLLLEDIQNFHQKNTPTPTSFSLPPCVTKACSIVEAVADLNSCTSSNFSSTFSEERKSQFNKTEHNLAGKKRAQPKPKDPFVESEVNVVDDLMEPSLHKYVTVTRGGNGSLGVGGGEIEEEESSGSNSFVGGGSGQQRWGISSSSWEPNSADSTDRWTSRSLSESGREMEEARRGFTGKRRDLDHHQQQHSGIGRGRAGGNRGPQTVAVAAST